MAKKKKIKRKASGLDGPVQQGFHLMAKPAGPRCNLHCEYCFYLEKKTFFPESKVCRMSDEVLEAYTRKYIESQPGPSVVFAWQGGEPTLLGIDFFQRALDFQKKYNMGKQITNTLQTNGTILDEEWCVFLSRNNFLVGLSIDGPETVHDAYRVDRAGRPTSAKVLRVLRMMQRYGVEINVLASVNSESSRYPLEVYRFFKQQGLQFIQFIPIIEREADSEAERLGISLAAPPSLTQEEKATTVTPWTVEPQKYGEFLIRVFEEWIRNDVGKIFVMNFEWSLGAWVGAQAGVCYLSPRCGLNLIIEHNGDIFSCDHFVYPAYRLGNILESRLRRMVQSRNQIAFGASKETALPGYCRGCDVLFVCRGGCPKQRFAKSPDGEPGLNYLCTGFKRFYHHVNPYMKHMVKLIHNGIPVKKIMEAADALVVSE
ncbi:MAG: anaerobic sulfatase maturase [Candidatus Aminicenantes bacterium]|nr:MAG: anaerobic sulfatase maturase [Candidatus Aminicenantes bacterium]